MTRWELARATYRTLALLALLAGFVIVDHTDWDRSWRSCWRYECITQFEKEGLPE